MSAKVKINLPDDILENLRIEDERAELSSATSVAYIHEVATIEIQMQSGVAVRIPVRLISELHGASFDDLHHLSLAIGGDAISWPLLDVDIALSGLLRDVLGLNFQRLGGLSTSEKKKAAARANGAKGGRPRITAQEIVRIPPSDVRITPDVRGAQKI